MRRFRGLFRGGVVCGLLMAGLAHAAPVPDVLVLCAEDRDIRPWITHDGNGLNFELLNRVSVRVGVRFEYRQMPWKRCLEDLKQGGVEGAFGASFKSERLEAGAYPGGRQADPAMRLNMDRYVLVRAKGSDLAWDGFHLKGLRGAVGVQLGYSVADNLRALGISVDEGAPGAAELMRKLFAGHVQAVAMLDGEARRLLVEDPRYGAVLEILPVPLIEKPYYLMLSNRLVKARPKLAESIWRGIEQVRESREYQLLEKQALEKQQQ